MHAIPRVNWILGLIPFHSPRRDKIIKLPIRLIERIHKRHCFNNLYLLDGFVRFIHLTLLHPCQRVQSAHHPTEDCVCVVQVTTAFEGDEELGAVGVSARVGHTENAPFVVDQPAEGGCIWWTRGCIG